MTVNELKNKLNLTPVVESDYQREIKGIYTGDLLSFAMSHARKDNLWITIMANVNVAAVASLTEVAAVIITNGVSPDSELIKKSIEHEINILKTPKTSAEITILAANS